MAETETYRIALKEARESFDDATLRMNKAKSEIEELSLKITKLRRTITALAAMCSESPWTDALGITDTCMEVMEDMPWEMSTAEVVEGLESIGFDLSSQKNAAASVHAVLSRLAEKGKIKKIENDDRKTTWRGPAYDPDIPF